MIGCRGRARYWIDSGIGFGDGFLDSEFIDRIDRVSERFRGIATSALVDRVYHDHPWFTMNSEATEKRAMDRPKSPRAVYTVGYEGHHGGRTSGSALADGR